MWDLHMLWARELIGMLTSSHWGSRFGLYLVLTEHVAFRQVFRIAQARRPAFSPLFCPFVFSIT
eukprot:4076749-Pleurochrysis_carterae.AAC.1